MDPTVFFIRNAGERKASNCRFLCALFIELIIMLYYSVKWTVATLIVKCCGTKGGGKIKKGRTDAANYEENARLKGFSETEKERQRGDVLCIYWLTQSCWGSFNQREKGRFFLCTLPSFTFLASKLPLERVHTPLNTAVADNYF